MQRIFSLKGHMLLNNIFIFILPTLIIGYITISISNHQVQESVKQSNNIMVLNVNNQVENFIKSPISIINGLEKELLLKDNISDEKINKYLDEIIKIYPYFNNIEIISKDGFVKNTALFNKEKIGTNVTNKDFLKKIDKSGKLVWSSVFISDQTQKPTVSISLYVNENLLVVDLNLSIIKISQDTTSGSVQNISILDGKGIYLVDNNHDNVNQRRQFAYFNEIKNEAKNQGTTINDKNNNKLILYSTKNKHTGWYSVITLNSNKVFEPIIKIKNTFYISFTIMILLYFILSELSIVNITRDFNNLINKTKLISAGDYSIYPKIRGYSEFVELYKYFDIMKENVQLRENDILSLNLELEDKVFKRTKQLDQTNYELEELNSSLEGINCELEESTSLLYEEIAENQRVAKEISKLNEQLEDRVVKRTRELQNMNLELEVTNAQLEAEVLERAKVDKALQKSEELYRNVYENSPLAFGILDKNFKFIDWNKRAEEIFIWSKEEVIGKRFMDFLVPKEINHSINDLAKKIIDAEIKDITCTENITKDGRILFCEWHNSMLHDEKGNLIGFISMALDKTENIKAEKEVTEAKNQTDKINDKLKQANSNLKKEILERIAIEEQLTKSKLEAEQANIAKSQFLANMSHEIRTPINGIMGMTQLALMTDLNEEPREYLTLVMKSAKVLLAIINNVLDFSKIEAGKIIIESKPFKIKDVINEVTTLFDISANEKGIVLSAEIDKNIPIILNGDAIKLRQILSNIIGNAVKFTEMGKVIVGLSMDYIDENTVKVKFSIKDTGIGISKDKQGLLFERFEQLDSTYTKQYQGSGLGLAISKNLVELMGGDIWLESEERIGSTFYFTTNLQKEIGVCII
ncbi:ATP-binding protein [Clostridium tagluense]|uniref:ATP-binding protein n=1 Tax=Clostridium tagluense TaxID=360422 RepID=UPI001CF43275|nr:ATP-binding protein [Clostridium tagluense]MCB2297398.1 PAS domain S-box protein [Clostridium tagluense]